MAAGDWRGARGAFTAALEVAEVAEVFFGLASALFWLGDIAGTIANCEKVYVVFRRRGILCSRPERLFRWWDTTRDTWGTRLRPGAGCRERHGSLTMRFRSCGGTSRSDGL